MPGNAATDREPAAKKPSSQADFRDLARAFCSAECVF
jgi:hypothetical protein